MPPSRSSSVIRVTGIAFGMDQRDGASEDTFAETWRNCSEN